MRPLCQRARRASFAEFPAPWWGGARTRDGDRRYTGTPVEDPGERVFGDCPKVRPVLRAEQLRAPQPVDETAHERVACPNRVRHADARRRDRDLAAPWQECCGTGAAA